MPSKVRGILYNENTDEIINSLIGSIQMLIDNGCNHIVLACNTSHYYLPDIFKEHPEFKPKIINIIDLVASKMHSDDVKKVQALSIRGDLLVKNLRQVPQ